MFDGFELYCRVTWLSCLVLSPRSASSLFPQRIVIFPGKFLCPFVSWEQRTSKQGSVSQVEEGMYGVFSALSIAIHEVNH